MKMMIRAIALAGLMATVSAFAQTAVSDVSTGGSSGTASAATSAYALDAAESSLNDALSILGAVTYGSGSGSGSVLIVPAGEMSIESLTAATEDMNVMGRILASGLKQTEEANTGRRLGDVFGFAGGWNGTSTASYGEGIYLQGYGVLFTMKVSFPLSPGPDSNEPKEKPAKTDGDTVWQQAKQDLYAPSTERAPRRTPGQPKYSAERVESLKTAIITALKHAANIRGLQPAESVIVTIIGQSTSPDIARVQTIQGTDEVVVIDRTGTKTVYKGGLPENIKQSTQTVLTIRAKISDVTSFSKGDLNLDQFRQKVQVLSHPYLGGRAGSTTMSSIVVPSAGRRPVAVPAPPAPTPQPQVGAR